MASNPSPLRILIGWGKYIFYMVIIYLLYVFGRDILILLGFGG
jgi:hypothetical protein